MLCEDCPKRDGCTEICAELEAELAKVTRPEHEHLPDDFVAQVRMLEEQNVLGWPSAKPLRLNKRDVVEQLLLDYHTVPEIANIAGCSERYVWKIKCEARKKLRDK